MPTDPYLTHNIVLKTTALLGITQKAPITSLYKSLLWSHFSNKLVWHVYDEVNVFATIVWVAIEGTTNFMIRTSYYEQK